MMQFPSPVRFETEEIQARINDVRAERIRVFELKTELFEIEQRRFDIARALGKRVSTPTAPSPEIVTPPETVNMEKALVAQKIKTLSMFGDTGKTVRLEHWSEDGFSGDTEVKYSYEIVEGALSIASLSKIRERYWTGSDEKLSAMKIVFDLACELPVYRFSDTTGPDTASDKAKYQLGSWRIGAREIDKLTDTLRWQRACSSISELIRVHGQPFSYTFEHAANDTVARRITIDDGIDEWLLQAGDKWCGYDDEREGERESLHVSYKNKLLDRGFAIELSQKNFSPRINESESRHINERNYLDYVEKVIDHVAGAVVTE